MGEGCIRSTSKVSASTYIIQHLFKWFPVSVPILYPLKTGTLAGNGLSDLFLIIDEIKFARYVNDNSLYDAGNTVEDVILSLQESSENLF